MMSDSPQHDEIDYSPVTIIRAMIGTFTDYHHIRKEIFRTILHTPELFRILILGLIRLPLSSLTHRFFDVLNNLPMDGKNAGYKLFEDLSNTTNDGNLAKFSVNDTPQTEVLSVGKRSKKAKKKSRSFSSSEQNNSDAFESTLKSFPSTGINPLEDVLLLAFGNLFIHQTLEAERRFNRILQKEPKNLLALFGLCTSVRISHQFAKSLTLLERLNENLPNNPFILNRLGMIYGELQQYPRAKNYFDLVFRIAPTDIFSYIDWSWYLIEQHEFDQAKQLLLRGLSIDPKESLLYSGLGDAYSLQELAHESLTFYQQATEMDEFNIQAWKNLGLTLIDLNNLEQAAACFLKIEQIDKSRPDGNVCFGWLLIAQEKYQEAIERFKLALKTDPQNGEIHLEIAKCYKELGADAQYLQYLQLAKRFDTLNPEVHFALGEYYVDHELYPNAKEAFQAALKLNPHHVLSLNGLALLEYFEFNDLVSAINLFNQALAHDPKNVLTLFNMSEVYLDSGSIANAERTLKQILLIDPRDVNALYSLGVLAKTSLRNYPSAEKYLLKVLEIDEMYILAYFELVEVYIENKMLEKVLPLLDALKHKFPNDPVAQQFIEKIRHKVNSHHLPPSKP